MHAEDDDYHGPVINRIARLEGITHGGQILVSDATRSLVEDSLPEGVSMVDLGNHTLRGTQRSERVFQLSAIGLSEEFPPLLTSVGGGVGLPTYPCPGFIDTHSHAAVTPYGGKLALGWE